MKTRLRRLSRAVYTLVGMLLLVLGSLPLIAQPVLAAQQVTSRSIEISNSTVSATGVNYDVSFTAQTAALSLVVDFCQNNPIIGAACTTTNGVTFSSPTITASNLPAGWAYDTSSGSTIKLKGTVTSLSTSTAYSFTITNVNNPTAAGSFYARIYTYANNTYGTYASAASPGNYVDYGGFALSTANNVSITATVMETLTFCVSGLAPGPSCGQSGQAVTTPTVILGSGSPPTIDSFAVYDNSAANTSYTQLSTNAVSGAIVRMKATNTCSGLSRDSGATCPIPGQSTAGAITAGTAAFGLQVGAGSGGTGTVTGTGSYGTGGSTYYMDNGASGVTSTYGSNILASSGAVNSVNNQLIFATTANATTPAGIYTANEILIATGTF